MQTVKLAQALKKRKLHHAKNCITRVQVATKLRLHIATKTLIFYCLGASIENSWTKILKLSALTRKGIQFDGALVVLLICTPYKIEKRILLPARLN